MQSLVVVRSLVVVLVQDQKTCSGMVGATLAVAQGRRKAGPYSRNLPIPSVSALAH